MLDFNDPNSQKIPFAREAWEYYVNKILPSQSAGQGTGTCKFNFHFSIMPSL